MTATDVKRSVSVSAVIFSMGPVTVRVTGFEVFVGSKVSPDTPISCMPGEFFFSLAQAHHAGN